jgi:hypothetical protein
MIEAVAFMSNGYNWEEDYLYLSNQPFKGVGAQATYQYMLQTFPSAQTPKCLIESLGD